MNRDARGELPQIVSEEQIPGKASREFTRELRREKRRKWLRRALITVVFSALIGAIPAAMYLGSRGGTTVEAPAAETTQESKKTLAFYAVQTSSTQDGEKQWPVYTVYQRVVGEDDETALFTVGSIGANPANMMLTGDGKYVVVNYQTKLSVYAVATKREAFSFTSGSGLTFTTPVLSADNNKIFTYEVAPAQNGIPGYSAFATTIDLQSGQQIRDQLPPTSPSLVARAWAPDGKIVSATQNSTEFSVPYVYDPSAKVARPATDSDQAVVFTVSDDGSKIFIPSDPIDDANNCLEGNKSFSGYKVFDTVTGKQATAYADSIHVYEPTSVRFSSDSKKLVLERRDPVTGDCSANPTPPTELWLQTVEGKDGEKLDDTSKLADKGFALRLQVVPDNPASPTQMSLKFGDVVVRSVDARTSLVPVGTLTQ